MIELKVIGENNERIWLISIFEDHSRCVLSSIKCKEVDQNIFWYGKTYNQKVWKAITDPDRPRLTVLQFAF
ncbi:MAG TPA: hypothetical protein VFP25_03980 [Nitrososphaeraceae archaeon]|nr:hypothetical protein [Nitrososphaeraceae archaeon]